MTYTDEYLQSLVSDLKVYTSCIEISVVNDLEDRGVSDITEYARSSYVVLKALQFGIDLGKNGTSDFSLVVANALKVKANYTVSCPALFNPYFNGVTSFSQLFDLSDYVRKTGPAQSVSSVIIFQNSPQVPEATGPHDAVAFDQIGSLINLTEIIDRFTSPDPTPGTGVILNILNHGDLVVPYNSPTTGANSLAIGSVWVLDFPDDEYTPDLTLDTEYFYAIEIDDIPSNLIVFRNSVATQLILDTMTKSFAEDLLASSGGSNINIYSHNLIMTAIDVDGSTDAEDLTVFKIVNASDDSVVYDAGSSITDGFVYMASPLGGGNYKVLVSSPNTGTLIVVESAGGVVTKTQNFLTGDTDNLFQAPIRVSIQPA